jgi:L-lactate dehydrogenase complex protein LldG
MSSHTARERILSRLKASGTHQTEVPEASLPPQLSLDREARIERLTELMTAIRTEVHIVDADSWIEKLKVLAREKGWKRMLYGPGASIGSAIENAWAADSQGLPDLMAYTEPVETFKDDLFHLDAGITTTRGAVADSGAVVLWPTVQEPRLMSLVPPVHVAVLDADTIYNSLAEMMAAENWSDGMPTNALLISGPSKTADIEFTLVFGVHGPKELIVLVRK